jgi:hypothetical protein
MINGLAEVLLAGRRGAAELLGEELTELSRSASRDLSSGWE